MIKLGAKKIMVTIPPTGAAREYTLSAIQCMQKLPGLDVHTFDFGQYEQGYGQLLTRDDPDLISDMCNQSLLTKVFELKPKIVLVTALSPVSNYFLQIYAQHKITTAHWFFEDFRRAHYWEAVAPNYDYFFAIQKGILEQKLQTLYRSQSRPKYFFIPNGSSIHPEDFDARPVDLGTRKYDICFVGIPTPYRIQMLESLVVSGLSLVIAGAGWEQYNGLLQNHIIAPRQITTQQALTIYQQSKIGLNIGTQQPTDAVHEQISPRAYDILGCATVLLCEDIPLNPLALAHVAYTPFNQDNLAAQCRQILLDIQTQPQAINEQCKQNQKTIFAEHLLAHRIESITDIIFANL
jgi:hypothetical protein